MVVIGIESRDSGPICIIHNLNSHLKKKKKRVTKLDKTYIYIYKRRLWKKEKKENRDRLEDREREVGGNSEIQ